MDKSLIPLIDEYHVQETTIQAVMHALHEYYSGKGSLTECLDREEECSAATYYRWSSKRPELVQELKALAKEKVAEQRSDADTAFLSKQLDISQDIQSQAFLLLQKALPALGEVALGRTREVMIGEGEDQEIKYVVTYPRDQVEAVKRLQELARGGVLPEGWLQKLQEDFEDKGLEEGAPSLSDLMGTGVPANFKKITAERKDGSSVSVEISDADYIEGEVKDV